MRNLKAISVAQALIDYDAATGTEAAVILAETVEIERHLHNYERWFGISGNQSGDNWGDEDGQTPFVASSAAGDFGTAIKLLGPDDTPVQSGMTLHDVHRILVTDMSSNVVYTIHLIQDMDNDNDADVAEGKGYYTTIYVIPGDTNTNRAGGFPVTVIDKRMLSGLRTWAKVKAAGTVDIDFFLGIHEYPE